MAAAKELWRRRSHSRGLTLADKEPPLASPHPASRTNTAMPIASDRAGHIVALEGPEELVSTQLRLLPPSRQILILPSIQHYLREAGPRSPFDPRALIYRYHTASQTRHAEALDFLRPSTSTNEERLVFMHGGTVSAHVSCLSAIMAQQTDGDIEEAYAAFVRLASKGVRGLSLASSCTSSCDSSEGTERDEPPEPAASSEEQGRHDAWTGCMQVADDDTIEDRIIRAMRAADALDKETEFLQPATPDIDLTVKLVDIPPIPARSKRRPVSRVMEPSETLRSPKSPDHPGVEAPLQAEPAPHGSAETDSVKEPASAAPRKPPLRLRIPSPPIPWACDVAAGTAQYSPIEVYQPQGPFYESNLSPTQTPTSDSAWCDASATPTGPTGQLLSEQQASVDQAESEMESVAETESQPFGSVLPMLEDLVVFFTPDTTDELHNFVVRRLSEVCKTPRLSVSTPTSTIHDDLQGPSDLVQGEDRDIEDAGFEDEGADEVSPWMRKDLVHGLPTPNHSPTALDVTAVAAPLPGPRLYTISVDQETAVSIQNFLRSFLGSRFPLHGRRFSATGNAESSSEAGLWRPLECDSQVTSPDGERRLDLILAVGAETGVKKGRLSEVVGQIEKLGCKTSGHSRSGRLHIRSLIASAMQAFTAQPLTKQTQNNPFADRALLAALIIPHLEKYLQTHPDVRFLLIEYPSEHLPTVLALQTLIGTDMMKVVGIINSDASGPSQSLALPDAARRPSEGFRSLYRRGSSASAAFVGPCAFSKANFLLASSATGFETAAFVAAIRESLISISDYYIPERPLYKPPPAAQSTSRKAYSSLTASSIKSSPSQKESSSRASGSPSVITPPSSPTNESSTTSPAAHSHSHSHSRKKSSSSRPRTIPRRTSSIRTTSTQTRSRIPRTVPDTNPPPMVNARGIRWGEINYGPDECGAASSSPPPSAPSIANSTTTAKSSAASSRRHYQHHQKKDSEPLSPRGTTSSSNLFKAGLASGDSGNGIGSRGGQGVESDDDDDDDEDDDDLIKDEEMRRLMPLYLRRKEDIERMRSTKAFRWLGLS